MTDEAPRPLPPFYVTIGKRAAGGFRGDDELAFALQDVYDIAIGSMDFGSGFLSTEEVGNLRKLGQAIGAEHFDYQHDKCLRCGHEKKSHYFYPRTKQRCQRGCKCKAFISPIEGRGNA